MMKNGVKINRFIILSSLIFIASLTRILPLFIPYIWNFTALGALAVFSGAQFDNRRLAYLVPLACIILSDLIIGNGFIKIVYLSVLAMVFCGRLIHKNLTLRTIIVALLGGALVFYLINNFALLYSRHTYSHNLTGIFNSYRSGLPFLIRMVFSNLIYGTFIFGIFYLLEKQYPALASIKK